jgi:hypothetical protein
MKKNYLLMVLLAGLAFNPIKAQTKIDTTLLVNAYTESGYVFEGIVQNICSYQDPSTKNLYTSNTIQITKVFKGNLQCGTVNIITLGGIIEGYEMNVSHEIQFNIGVTGVFLCNNSTYPTDRNSICPIASNVIPLSLTYSEIGSIEYLFDNVNAQVVGFKSQFPTIQSFYDFLAKNGINVIDCGSSLIQQKILSQHSIKVKPNIVMNQPSKINTNHVKILESKKSLYNKNIYSKTNEQIGFTIGNVGFNSTSTAIVIEIKVDGSLTYLDNAIFQLHYNPATFGTNISNKISSTLGTNFLSTGVYSSSSFSDYNDSTLEFLITADFNPSTRTQINSTAQTVVTATIPLSSSTYSCKYSPNFKIVDLSTLYLVSYFTVNASDITTSGIRYTTYNSGSSNSGPTCIPVINSLSITTPTTGGTGVTLNIYGSDFGTSNGSVFMKNADCGSTDSISNGPIYIPIDKYDITWTNTMITINVPSISDHGWDSGTYYIRRTPGTGNIIVKDQWGLKSVDYNPITIRYSVYNQSKGSGTSYYKNNEYLFSANTDSIYHFKLNSNISSTTYAGTDMINCIKAAFNKWTCMTGVGFVLDLGTSVSNNADSDGVNVITLSNNITDHTTIAYTAVRSSSLCSTGSSIPFSTAEVDIAINNYFVTNNLFTYDTTGTATINSGKTDFFSVILHELGHAHLLKHVAFATNDVMYYSQPPKPTAPSDRLIHFNTNNYNGGTYIVTNSMAQNYGMSCAFKIPMKKFGNPCGATTAVDEASNSKEILSVYPNPFKDAFEIQFTSKETQEEAQIIIYNTTGQEIIHLKNISLTVGNNTIKIDNFIYPNGLYLVLLKTKEGTFFTKEVCVK